MIKLLWWIAVGVIGAITEGVSQRFMVRQNGEGSSFYHITEELQCSVHRVVVSVVGAPLL